MTFWGSLASICITISCLQLCQCSYLGYPRIHFAGHFRADSDTRNNMPCNYIPNIQLDPNTNDDWGFNGTNEWQFFDTKITLAVYNDRSNSTMDPVVGSTIVGNLERPYSKLVDLDVDCQDHSTIYGLNFGVRWSDDQPASDVDLAFYGKWTRSVVAQSMWPRLKCYSDTHYGEELYEDSFPIGAQGTTTITNINWGNMKYSRALQELKQASGGKNLAVRVSHFYYTRNYPPYIRLNATLGYIVGVIGVPSADDTLNVPGKRVMGFTWNMPKVSYTDPNDLCYQQNLASRDFAWWMNDAPFEVDYKNREVCFDLSNSVPTDLHNTIRYFGTLRLGILLSNPTCVHLLGDERGIQYRLSRQQLGLTSGIYNIAFDSSLVDEVSNNSLVIVQMLDGDSGKETQICGERKPIKHTVRILLQEPTYFIRPQGYYVDRLERNYHSSSKQTLYVTKYGVPAANVGVLLSHSDIMPVPLPNNGVTPTSFTGTSSAGGFVEFVFNIDAEIPKERLYGSNVTCKANGMNVTTLPLDGQIFYFSYCVNSAGGAPVKCSNSGFKIVFLAFSEFQNKSTYNWVDDVGPVLTQYARVSKIMATILNLSNYSDVTQPRNIHLLNFSLNLDFENPSYMPTTRDLSTAKRNMITNWLKNPIYDSKGSKPRQEISICVPPNLKVIPLISITTPRCSAAAMPFLDHPQVLEHYFEEITEVDHRFDMMEGFISGRPLSGSSTHMVCSRDNVATQLQTAITLEWATIPTYLTSLYSIVDGCNTEIYNIIRSVVMQEMLHFTQAANILIAMGEKPVIDSSTVTPKYPTHLPGYVLPKLLVNLEKLSLEHVHRVLMGIELPENTDVAQHIHNNLTTIGYFYGEISDCIEQLGDDIFYPSTLKEQVNWPWDPTDKVGYVVPVTNATSAMAGIQMIISQGEGTDDLDPMDIANDTLAHFFKFEEIVCGHKLKQISDETYAYTGEPIPFRADGVWPMRDNPSVIGILPHTNCYTESRVFHKVYRALLRKLQEVFTGRPGEIDEAIAIMESLHVHAKKLMWTKYRPDSDTDGTTCGPVWDYDWPGPVWDYDWHENY